MSDKPFTWAYSTANMFKTCPKQYYHLKVLKDYTENFDTPDMTYGKEFHKAAENYIGKDESLPAKFEFARSVLDKIKTMEGAKLCEYRIGLTEKMQPCAFFAKDVWLRAVIDLAILNGKEARVIDYKTGGNTAWADKGQLELMSLVLFKHHPEVNVVKSGLLYVVANAFIRETYSVENEAALWAKWLGTVGEIQKARRTNVWNPKPSGLCNKHCIVESCIHNGRNS